jgi:hypothetical protein
VQVLTKFNLVIKMKTAKRGLLDTILILPHRSYCAAQRHRTAPRLKEECR